MALETPALADRGLAELASRYVKTDEIPWEPMTQCSGVQMKILVQDKETGLFTGLFKFDPGAVIPDHVRNEIEQTYILEGEFEDDDGVATTGDFIWRPAGNRHEARSPKGCLILGFFLKPNTFL